MRIDVEGQTALVVGGDERVAGAIAAALEANGALAIRHEPEKGADGRDAVAEALRRTGRLDILVVVGALGVEADAGLAMPDDLRERVGEPVEALAAFCSAALEPLRERQGRVVAVASVLGTLPARVDPALGAADAAIFSLVRALAMRFGPLGVRINALAVGAIAGEGRNLLSGDPRFLSHVPLGRPGTLENLADAALFLADPDNSYLTGHVLTLDGGWSAGFARDF